MTPAVRSAAAVVVAIAVVLAGCATSGTIVATETVEDELTVEADAPLVAVETFNGRISVTTGGIGAIDIRIVKRGSGLSQADAEDDLRAIEVTIVPEAGRITVTARRTDAPVDLGNSGADVELSVPADASLDLRTSNGRIEAANVTGSIVARSSNGGITIRGGTNVSAETSNGPLTVTEAIGRLELRTSNGALDMVAVADASVTAETSNGAVTFSGSLVAGESRIRTSNAPVRIALPADSEFSMSGHTSNGAISVSPEFPLTISNGSVTGSVGGDPKVSIRIETSNGDLSVTTLAP